MRRIDKQTSIERAWEIFDESNYALVSMIHEGKPYSCALSVARIGEMLYFHSAKEGEKIHAMRTHPDVCLHAVAHMENVPEIFSVYYASCTIKGRAYEVVDTEEKHQALLAICEKFATENMQLAEKEIQGAIAMCSVWRIEVDEITGKVNQKKG